MRGRKNGAGAIAEVFWTAFQSLPKTERHEVVHRLASSKEFREDILDLVVFEMRRGEASRPFREYLGARAKKRA